LNLPPRASMVTIEPKTNLFRSVREGHVSSIFDLLHIGRSTIVVQTDLFDADGNMSRKRPRLRRYQRMSS
jgi:1,4-dihydroxy-2-naphthoyl-CoA hydrolase